MDQSDNKDFMSVISIEDEEWLYEFDTKTTDKIIVNTQNIANRFFEFHLTKLAALQKIDYKSDKENAHGIALDLIAKHGLKGIITTE